MNNENIGRKLDRLHAGGKPRVLDLFSGCGGLSLGFEAAGCSISAAVEFDEDAARSHGFNFHGGDAAHSLPVDITTTRPQDLARRLGLGPVRESVDIIVGGPPCQAFARVGRSKLREIEAHPEAFVHDPRARLYQEYLRYVDAFDPVAVVMENVPDMLNHGGRNIAEETCEVLRARGYVCRYTLLNSAFYGVPQMRERMFLVAYRKEAGAVVAFPAPTHWLELPAGYGGSRAVAKLQQASKAQARLTGVNVGNRGRDTVRRRSRRAVRQREIDIQLRQSRVGILRNGCANVGGAGQLSQRLIVRAVHGMVAAGARHPLEYERPAQAGDVDRDGRHGTQAHRSDVIPVRPFQDRLKPKLVGPELLSIHRVHG